MTLKNKIIFLLTAAGITLIPGTCTNAQDNPPVLEQIIEIDVENIKIGEPVQPGKKIVIDKSERKLSTYLDGILIKEYGVSLGAEPKGDKNRRGDMKTPEGEFYVAKKLPNSSFYKALLISYPNKEDAERGLKSKLIGKKQYQKINTAIDKCKIPLQKTRLGSSIELHGGGGGPGHEDWTWGCIALNNEDMEEVYNFADTGCETKVLIKP